MDYGKLAYVKAEEIERYLRMQESGERTSVTASFHPRAALEDGYEPCSVSGRGNIALTVSLSVSAPLGADDIKVRLCVGGEPVAYTVVRLTAGNRAGVTLVASVYPTEDQKIRVDADREGLILEEIGVLAVGENAYVTGGQEGYRSDGRDGIVYLARENNGYIELSKWGDDKTVSVAHGGKFDLIATDGGVEVLCCDDDGNIWGVCYDSELNELKRDYMGDGADGVAIGYCDWGRLLVLVCDKKIRIALANEKFDGLTDWSEPIAEGADSAYLSRGERSALFYRKGGSLYVRLPVREARSRAGVQVMLGIEKL